MITHITTPVVIDDAGTSPILISEFIGRIASGTESVSIAVLESPAGWSEPGQTPEFDEYTIVLQGALTVETRDGVLTVRAGEAVHTPANEWVRYSTPASSARYVAVCLPAFSLDAAHRDA